MICLCGFCLTYFGPEIHVMILAAVVIVSRNPLVTSANAGNTNVISRGTKHAKQASSGGDVMDECLAA